MQKLVEIRFTCPLCQKSFDYDEVSEYELVKCPACRTNLVTVNKGQGIELAYFDY